MKQTPNAERPTPNIECRVLDLKFDVRCWVFDVRCFLPRGTSERTQSPESEFCPPTFDFYTRFRQSHS
jgi:hypothetical protein